MNAQKDILVVDDEPSYMTVLNKELKTAGYRPILARNGEEALVALLEKDEISVVLLDVRLPVINGLNISQIIRKDFPDKKVIVTSVLQKEEQNFLIDDADDYYDKSEDFDNLMEKIENALYGRVNNVLKDNEKRSHKRIPVNVLANCEKLSHAPWGGSHFIAYTKDLSLWGGKFVVGKDIKVGQHLSIALELPVHFLPLLIDAEVVWMHKREAFGLASKGNAEAGIRFVKLDSPSDEEKLKSYLNCI